MTKPIAVVCDFDGTITEFDLSLHIVEKFALEGWQKFDYLLDREKISIQEYMIGQYTLIRATKEEIFREIDRAVRIRPNFNDFIQYCKRNKFTIKIVSGGLDIVIYHVLKTNNWNIPVIIAESKFISNKIDLKFPDLQFEDSIDYKDDTVKKLKQDGYSIIFIGDGSTDFNGVRHSDFSFVVKDSILSELCQTEKLPHFEFDTFADIIDYLDKNIIGSP